jgi:hypothetical protein
MNADHGFFIGNTHPVCQDYAMSDVVDGGAFAIVSDGCSGSPDVDFGARALALSAKRTLSRGGVDLSPDLFGKVTIDNLKSIGDNFPLDPKSLDATLLVTWVKGKEFKAHMFGDGMFFHQTATTIRIVHVEYESNTPAYLSYYLDKLRLKNYEDTVMGSKRIIDISLYRAASPVPADAIETEDYVKPFVPVSFTGLVDEGDIIGVCSDGINSFRKGDGSVVSWETQIREFIDFKSTAGVFVQRRLGFLKRQWQKQLTTHYDDISMAAIIV